MQAQPKSITIASPIDWPLPGPIDLAIHDLPHASSAMEWWYVNAHLTVSGGRRFSLFAAFFRVDTTEAGKSERSFSHFLTWALVDPSGRRYFPNTLLDAKSPYIAVKQLDDGKLPSRDDRLSRALREVFEQGKIPLPDRLLESEAYVGLERLALDYDGNTFVKNSDATYSLDLMEPEARQGCSLRFRLEKPVVRHGDDGVVRGLSGEEMFYYLCPRCSVEGAVIVDGERLTVTDGAGWYDHEFGDRGSSSGGFKAKVAWNWVAAQLDNGCEVTAYDLVDRNRKSDSVGRWIVVVDPSGNQTSYKDFSLETFDNWTSSRTFNEYPTRYCLTAPTAGLVLDLCAVIPAQEMMTVISAPGFWEGAVAVSGSMNGTRVAGKGFIERSGASVVDTTDDFLSSVSRATRRAIETLLPEHLTAEQAEMLIGGPGRARLLDGVDLEQYARTVVRPIREIILRGGKAWRSYAVLAGMDLVGGNSQAFLPWLALPELLHVGSLIIDDVQDGSELRRGGPACHKIYGEALAINAGCASYFLAQIPMLTSGLSEKLLVRIYENYFEAIRAAHAGQALDIDTLASFMPSTVEDGDGSMLERRVLATHRLKSAVPPGAIARVAALVGGGTDEQAEALSRLFEALGLAFQIVDDVLNLRGFEENRKSRAEDITHGKITAPVAKAMGLLALEERRRLWSIIESRTSDPDRMREAVQLIEGCGALRACEDQARDMVETAWTAAAPLLPDSQFKVRLRAFGWFLLDRHY